VKDGCIANEIENVFDYTEGGGFRRLHQIVMPTPARPASAVRTCSTPANTLGTREAGGPRATLQGIKGKGEKATQMDD
jgi:hypothetical protein